MKPAAAFLVALLALAACAEKPGDGSAAPEPAVPVASNPTGGEELCLGRYALRLPAGARVIARAQGMDGLDLRVRALEPGTALADVPARAPWLSRADRATLLGPAISEMPDRTVVLTWRATDRDAAVVDTEAIRLLDDTLLAAHARSANTQQALAHRTAALALLAAAEARPEGVIPARGFCIDRLTIRRGFSGGEFAGLVAESPRPWRLFVTTRSNDDAAGPRLAAPDPGAVPADTRVIRAGQRTAGGHQGDELVLSRTRGRMQDMLLAWRFVGVPHSGAGPAVELRLEAPGVAVPEEMLAEWDGLLASLHRRTE